MRACTAFEVFKSCTSSHEIEVRQKHRSTQLARLLQGKALADDEVDDYGVLKAQLLKRFRLTEGVSETVQDR